MRYSYRETSHVSSEVLHELRARLEPERIRLGALLELPSKSRDLWYHIPESFMRVPYDVYYGDLIDQQIALFEKYDPAAVIVCGIGGSHYGAAALAELLKKNDADIPELLFVDTVDTDLLSSIISRIEKHAHSGRNSILFIISKSGMTIETRANGAVLLSLMQRLYGSRADDMICIIADTDRPLINQALQAGITTLEIPFVVGGRFSVFTAVGMAPLIACGIDRKLLWEGAIAGYEMALSNADDNPAIQGALIRYAHAVRGAMIHDMFIFGQHGRLLGEWYRQLLAESLGKRFDKVGRFVEAGITPTVSIGSQDLHSVAQLYLAGPRDKTITFVMFDSRAAALSIPQTFLSTELSSLSTTDSVHRALCDGTTAAFARAGRPFDLWHLSYTPYDVAYFMGIKMVETLYLAYLMGLNPFDQPDVELYKEEVRKRLI